MVLVDETALVKGKLPEVHELLNRSEIRIPSLIDELARIPDPRKARGKRHPLGAMLALACVALLVGYRSLLAISEWAHNYGLEYLGRFGFTRCYAPGQATWYRVLGSIDWQALKSILPDWVERVLAVLDGDSEWEGVALDGKTLRGSKKQGATDTHLLSALELSRKVPKRVFTREKSLGTPRILTIHLHPNLGGTGYGVGLGKGTAREMG